MDNNNNEGVEEETEDQHQNDIITIADDISVLNTKTQSSNFNTFSSRFFVSFL